MIINLLVTHVTGGKHGCLLNFIWCAQCLQPVPQTFLSQSKTTPWVGSFDDLLPPAYVVRREGTVFTGVCLSTGGRGVSQLTQRGRGSASQLSGGGVSQPEGVSPAGGGESAKIGQQNEYSLHGGGRYASCVHAGGLSCIFCFQSLRHTPLEELPTMVNTEQLSSVQGQSGGHTQGE